MPNTAILYRMSNQYVFVHRDQYVGLDGPSGGYPYYTDQFYSAKVWYKKSDARKYQRIMGIEASGWKLKRVVRVELEDVADDYCDWVEV